MSHVEIQERFNVRCSFLDALTIRMSIPFHWRTLLTQSFPPQPDLAATSGIFITLPGQDPRDVAISNSKVVYSALIIHNSKVPTAFSRWAEVEGPLRVDSDLERRDICLNPFKSVRDTKIQSLQYKIINRIIPCNVFLRQLRIRESDLCSFCNQVDSVGHFLFSCRIVQSLWNGICTWFERTVDIRLRHISLKEFVFGVPPNSNYGKIANYIVLQTKHFVHRQKLFHQGDLRLLHFLQELKIKLKCEKIIHQQEGKNARFRKWESVLSALG